MGSVWAAGSNACALAVAAKIEATRRRGRIFLLRFMVLLRVPVKNLFSMGR